MAASWRPALGAATLGFAVVAALALAAAAPELSDAAPPAPRNRLLARLGQADGLGSGFGVNIHFTEGKREELRRISDLGMRVVRTDLLWESVESRPGGYDWQRYDALVADAEAFGLKPLLILAYSNPLYAPRLPGRPDTPSLRYAPPAAGAARNAYLAFAAAAARRYRGRVIWEVWNEPDLNFGKPFDSAAYIALAQAACRQIRAQDPEAPVLGPAAASLASPFLRDFAIADQEGCFDGLSVHPYREEAPEGVLADWARLRGLIARRRPPGPERLPLLPVAGEWGYASVGGAGAERRQADYVARIALLGLVAGIPLTILYDWQNDGPEPDVGEANFGLLDFGGAPKPAHEVLAGLQRALRGQHYLGRVPTHRPSEFVLAFGSGEVVATMVAWTTAPRGAPAAADGEACLELPAGRTEGNCIRLGSAALGSTLPRLSGRPVAIAVPQP